MSIIVTAAAAIKDVTNNKVLDSEYIIYEKKREGCNSDKENELPNSNRLQLDDSVSNVTDESITGNDSCESHLALTKKGEIRKRRKYSTPLEQRKEKRVAKNTNKLILKAPCIIGCIKKCTSNISEDERILINHHYQKLNYVEKKLF